MCGLIMITIERYMETAYDNGGEKRANTVYKTQHTTPNIQFLRVF